ncbi:MAG: OsmC family protein [Bacteroidetes bacterium]|nr:OsmC family protein [Bacteroidota bacterium]
MSNKINYKLIMAWLGNEGTGTSGYKHYKRDFVVVGEGKPPISGSSDVHFLGDIEKYNPEEMLLMSVSSCHMLWFLHLCAVSDVVVSEYSDEPTGVLEIFADGGGKFSEITLRPIISIIGQPSIEQLNSLQEKANKLCFIANSLNIKINHEPGYFFTEV